MAESFGYHEENRTTRAEVFNRLFVTAENIIGFDGQTPEKIFDSENEQVRRELLDHLSEDDYCTIITGINGVLRDKEKSEWDMDGVGVTAAGEEAAAGHIFPNHDDKKDIIIKSFRAAKRMNQEQRNLEDIAMLLGSLLVETHPFNDGNGRTSRVVYSLINEGYSKEKIDLLLNEDGRYESDMALNKVAIDNLFNKKYGKNNNALNPNDIKQLFPRRDDLPFSAINFPATATGNDKSDIIAAARNDDEILTASILQFIKNNPAIDINPCIKKFPTHSTLVLQDLIDKLSDVQIEQLSQAYWEAKKIYTESIIDVFEHPDKEEYKIVEGNATTTILNTFKDRLRNKIVKTI